MERRMSFVVIEGGRRDRPAPAFVPDDDQPARGITAGVMLAIPLWCCLAGIAWWAWAVRP